MKRGSILIPVVLAFAPSLATVAAQTHLPTPSTWTLNLKASDFGGGPSMKSDVQIITVDTDKWMAASEILVDDTGKSLKTSWDGPADGTVRPIKGMPGATQSWNSATKSGHATMPDGTTIDETLTLSNSKKITFRVRATDKAGHTFHQLLVYDRTE